MKQVYEKIISNKTIRTLYKARTYLNIGSTEVGWFTTKLYDINHVLIFLSFLGILLKPENIIIMSPILIISVMLFGLIFAKSGLYTVERRTATKIDPVHDKILRAAEIIIKNEEKKRR